MARIFTSRKSGFIQRSGRMRRETQWIASTVINATPAAASTAIILTTLGAILALRPFTVVRTIGSLYARSDQTGALEAYSVRYGHCVVSDQAAAIGVTAVPTPDTDVASDLWFVFEEIFGTFGFISGVGALQLGEMVKFDSRGMRKVEEGQDMISVIEATSVSAGADTVTGFRQLLKLH